MSSTIRLFCPNLKCRKVLAVPANARGKTVRCRNCGMHVSVPSAGSTKKPDPAAEPKATG